VKRRVTTRLAAASLVLATFLVAVATRPDVTVAQAAEATPSPDLEIVALQSVGPGRVGDCNSVVARLHNRGTAKTRIAPSLRLDITGPAPWSRIAAASAPIDPGQTVEVWFEQVPLPAGLSRLQATSDPDHQVAESDETNNTRQVPRDPQVACGAPDPPPTTSTQLRVRVTASGDAGAPTPPIVGARVEVTSPLRAGVVVASGVTAADGVATLDIPFDSRTPVLRVTATSPGCAPGVQVTTPSGGSAALAGTVAPPGTAAAPAELTMALSCSAQSAPAEPIAKPGTLSIETALPGLLQIDDRAPEPVTFGTRREIERPGAIVRVRQTSASGTVFFDQTFNLGANAPRDITIDAPLLRAHASGSDVVEDLRTGLLWTVGAATTDGQPAAAAICDGLARGEANDWRLPDIDELAFLLEAHQRAAAPLRGLSDCCLWSTTEHAGGRLTFYLDGGHIYGRNADERGVGALCVRASAYPVDPVLVPARYHDRLPGARRFRPRD